MNERFSDVGELNRLRWRCTHRALRELDILLGGFLDQQFPGLSAQQAEAFAALAEMEDIDLWPLITGKRDCADSMQAEVVAMMRKVGVKCAR